MLSLCLQSEQVKKVIHPFMSGVMTPPSFINYLSFSTLFSSKAWLIKIARECNEERGKVMFLRPTKQIIFKSPDLFCKQNVSY